MELKSKYKVKGRVTAKCYDQSGLSFVERLYNKVLSKLGLSKQTLLKFYRFGPLKWQDVKTNLICNAGFQVIGEILTGVYGGAGEINYCALGDSATAVSTSDVALGNELYRNAIASGAVSANITYLTAFFTESECSGTYQEVGNFIDGGAGADSGEIWTHALTGGWVKSGTDALVVDFRYTSASS